MKFFITFIKWLMRPPINASDTLIAEVKKYREEK